jgi:hypothetical protein
MKWEILILTQPSRAGFLAQLMLLLMSKYEDVAVRTRIFDEKLNLGENREQLRRESSAEYISFVDDDDFVAPNFVEGIYPLLDGVDQVSFDVAVFRDGKPHFIAKHSLKYKGWYENGGIPYRDISHVHPMKRELALRVPMEGGIGEDFRWAKRMHGIIRSEQHIERSMYFYLWRTKKNDTLDLNAPSRLELLKRLSSGIDL